MLRLCRSCVVHKEGVQSGVSADSRRPNRRDVADRSDADHDLLRSDRRRSRPQADDDNLIRAVLHQRNRDALVAERVCPLAREASGRLRDRASRDSGPGLHLRDRSAGDQRPAQHAAAVHRLRRDVPVVLHGVWDVSHGDSELEADARSLVDSVDHLLPSHSVFLAGVAEVAREQRADARGQDGPPTTARTRRCRRLVLFLSMEI